MSIATGHGPAFLSCHNEGGVGATNEYLKKFLSSALNPNSSLPKKCGRHNNLGHDSTDRWQTRELACIGVRSKRRAATCLHGLLRFARLAFTSESFCWTFAAALVPSESELSAASRPRSFAASRAPGPASRTVDVAHKSRYSASSSACNVSCVADPSACAMSETAWSASASASGGGVGSLRREQAFKRTVQAASRACTEPSLPT
eukprot:scaffold149469_cov33-Tisochrysis_lutea.AAC.3